MRRIKIFWAKRSRVLHSAGQSIQRFLVPPFSRNTISAVAIILAVLIAGLGQHFHLPSVQAQTVGYCRFPEAALTQKRQWQEAALQGNKEAQRRYTELVKQHQERLQRCRAQSWPENQAIWIRLYPCDARPGVLDALFDRIVHLGYNEAYVEVFYSGQVLLPQAENRSPWPSVLRTSGAEKVDLLAQAIQKGHQRGLKVYAWMFTMNFGANYGRIANRQAAIARNSQGKNSLETLHEAGLGFDLNSVNKEELFIDPYSDIARSDYYKLVSEVAKRKPDGILFDYIRYPRGTGSRSVASRVQDLWIYGQASQQALYQRAQNQQGLELIRRFLRKGSINGGDMAAIKKAYPGESAPLWQGRNLGSSRNNPTMVQQELWYLTVAHAVEGVLDFLSIAATPAQQQGIPTGVVFFPDGNQIVGFGFDSRLQAWDRFPTSMEWHPMAYAVCSNPTCVVSQVERVLKMAPSNVNIKPVLAGLWGASHRGRPSLEQQMSSLRQAAPNLRSVSHFAYSWQEPEIDRARKQCRL